MTDLSLMNSANKHHKLSREHGPANTARRVQIAASLAALAMLSACDTGVPPSLPSESHGGEGAGSGGGAGAAGTGGSGTGGSGGTGGVVEGGRNACEQIGACNVSDLQGGTLSLLECEAMFDSLRGSAADRGACESLLLDAVYCVVTNAGCEHVRKCVVPVMQAGDGVCAATDPCGNGVRSPSEHCDDGNLVDGDGCTSRCVSETCGDGERNDSGREACDDGNEANGDGCDVNCTVSACSNGIRAGNEQCDDGNATNGDGCDVNCTRSACGNGQVGGAEACDDGNATRGDGCDQTCQVEIEIVCGDGDMGGAESCDDGNTADGDGCSADCMHRFVRATGTLSLNPLAASIHAASGAPLPNLEGLTLLAIEPIARLSNPSDPQAGIVGMTQSGVGTARRQQA